ncbi:hypothetical protein GYC56_005227 [Salmonella enterica]|nr:hypothetical protein [Salmonella enterica]
MLSKTGFTHSDLLCWQIDYAGGSLNVNGTIMRDSYTPNLICPVLLRNAVANITFPQFARLTKTSAGEYM